MGKKSGGGSGATGGSAATGQGEVPLCALVFADDLSSMAEAQACLGEVTEPMRVGAIPLVGAPLLAYQFEALARGGVEECLVLSMSERVQWIYDMLADDGTSYGTSSMTVTVRHSPGWRSAGDALREVEATESLRPTDDFVLVSCGAVFNLQVSELVREHKSRTSKDKNWLMTAVFRRGDWYRTTRPVRRVIAVDATTSQLISYSEVDWKKPGVRWQVDVETAFEEGHRRELEVLSDVIDCGLDICSPDILLEFKENFDFDCVRDYLKGKLEGGEADVLGNRISTRFVQGTKAEYAHQVRDLLSYHVICRDLAARWLYPITVDSNFYKSNSFQSLRLKGYKEVSTEIARSASFLNSVIGGLSNLEDNSSVDNSSLGERVVVGKGSRVTSSIVWDDVRIGEGTRVSRSVVATGVVLGRNCVIGEGCILGPGVEVLDGAEIGPGTWLTSTAKEVDSAFEEDEDSERSKATVIPEHLLSGNTRQVFYGHCEVFSGLLETKSEEGLLEDEMSDFSGLSDEEYESRLSEELGDLSIMDDPIDARFGAEIAETLKRAEAENHKADDAALEIVSLRMTYDRSQHVLVKSVVEAIATNTLSSAGDAPVKVRAATSFKYWSSLLINLVDKRPQQSTVLAALESVASSHADFAAALNDVLYILYDLGVLEEDAILEWETQVQEDTSRDSNVLSGAAVFLSWLREAEETDDNEDSDE